jgi:uncharacterized protein YfaS (alpha-2-macroglobulin family)
MNTSIKKYWVFGILGFVTLAVVAFFLTRSKSPIAIFKLAEATEVRAEFAQYISAYSGGVIPSSEPVKIVFAYDLFDSVDTQKPIDTKVFSFSPSISGKAYWASTNTIEFRPDQQLPSGASYKATLQLHKLIDVEQNDLGNFDFSFGIIPQNFDVLPTGMSFYDIANSGKARYTGKVITADQADFKQVETLLKATQNGSSMKITWPELGRKANEFPFIVENLDRKSKNSILKLNWDGSPLKIDKKGSLDIAIPEQGNFDFMNYTVEKGNERFIRLFFSEPIDNKQDMRGLVTLNGSQIRYLVSENELRLYPNTEKDVNGMFALYLDNAISSSSRQLLGYNKTVEIEFGEKKPNIEMTGSGVIIPGNGRLLVPFKAINLKAVEATVLKIPEQNMGFFLQQSDLDGGYSYELNRVAVPILKRTFSLVGQQGVDFSSWKHYHIDLSEYIKPEPGTLYRVSLNFKKEHTACNCPEERPMAEKSWWNSALSMIFPAESVPEAYTGSYSNEYYEYDYDYDEIDWSKRDDPCNPAFYYYGRSPKNRNLLASNLGLLAKGNADGTYMVHVSDIMSAKVLSGVKFELYDFQRQLIVEGKSDEFGSCLLKPSRKPFLLLATKDQDKGYLKLQDGHSLSLSNFDISGESIQKGIKGYIFGERGVWRPGDSLYLTFVMNDVQNPLPKRHPLSLEIFNPNDQLFKKMVKSTNDGYMYTFRLEIPEDAPTGNWKAKIQVGGAQFTKLLKIETIKPNRLKIDLDFGAEKLGKDKPVEGKLNVTWLHGAPVSNLKVIYEASFSASKTQFPEFNNFIFDNPAQRIETEPQVVFDGKLDNKGNAVIRPKLNFSDKAPTTVNINLKGRVFEESGDFSVDYLTLPYCPFKSIVGIQKTSDKKDYLETGSENTFELVNLNPNGKLLNGYTQAKVTLYKLDWRWWWESTQEDLAYYVNDGYARPVQSQDLTFTNGKGKWNINLSNEDWGRYLLVAQDKASGHRTGQVVFFDWPSSYSRENRQGGKWASMLTLHATKASYSTGEEVQINVPTPEGAQLLISIENSSKVLKTYRMDTEQGNTTVRFEADGSMAPNVFAHITLIQPWKDRKNDLPLRKYGVLALPVVDPKSKLEPVIKVADELTPSTPFQVSVKEAKGQDMDYVIAVVDEGLLSLTRFKTPNPWNTFFAREALGVKTWDLYDQVIEAYGADLEKLLAVGGDEELTAKDGIKQSRFKPVVMFLGPFKSKGGELKTHQIHMPNYIGAVRVMVVAASKNAYGNADKTCQVRQPLMVLGTLPRLLGPNEEVKLPVTLFAYDKSIKTCQVKLITDGNTTVVGANSKQVAINGKAEQMTYFTLKSGNKIGGSAIKIQATSGSNTAEYEVYMPIRNPFQPITLSKEVVVQAGSEILVEVPSPGGVGHNENKLEISSGPSLNLGERLNFLIRYPHGCVEQIVSGAFPQLYLGKLTQTSEAQTEKMTDNVKSVIDRLPGYQISDGGFSYWPGNLTASEWGTNYAGHFLLEAQKMGYQISPSMLANWKKFQARLANEYRFVNNNTDAQTTQAYRLYTLTLANAPEMGAMNRLKEQADLTQVARWYLACSYAMAGRKDVANNLLQAQPVQFTKYRSLSYTFGSDARDKAILLETYSYLDEETRTWQMMKEVSEILSGKEWLSTQTTAYCLSAASRFLLKTGAENSWKAGYTLPGSKETQVSGNQPYFEVPFQSAIGAPVKTLLKNEGKGALFVRLTATGMPIAESGISQAQGIEMDITYPGLGKVDTVELGQDITMVVRLSNISGRELKELALTLPIPAGWELTTTRMDGSDPAKEAGLKYMDIRDDRVYAYFDMVANEVKEIKFTATATYGGRYFKPAVQCEAMYDASINARVPGKWVIIK